MVNLVSLYFTPYLPLFICAHSSGQMQDAGQIVGILFSLNFCGQMKVSLQGLLFNNFVNCMSCMHLVIKQLHQLLSTFEAELLWIGLGVT